MDKSSIVKPEIAGMIRAEPVTLKYLLLTANNPDLLFLIPYIRGLRLEIRRYKRKQKKIQSGDMFLAITDCFYEAFIIMESLGNIATFMKERGHDHYNHKLWLQVRHHIIHDLRDAKPSVEQKGLTKKRAKYLGFGDLMTGIEPGYDSIKFGKREVKFKDVYAYLKWVESTIESKDFNPDKVSLIKGFK